jgi:hypothetical protein
LPVDTCPEIKHYIDLSIQFDKDTICMGDSLMLTIGFRNKTDEDIEFYPECFQMLTQPSDVFGPDEALILNAVSDLINWISLSPDSIQKKRVVIKSDNTFLHSGMNNIQMRNRCPTIKIKADQKYNKLCGTLESNIVNLYVYTSSP